MGLAHARVRTSAHVRECSKAQASKRGRSGARSSGCRRTRIQSGVGFMSQSARVSHMVRPHNHDVHEHAFVSIHQHRSSETPMGNRHMFVGSLQVNKRATPRALTVLQCASILVRR
jgi:hypothetical protein